MEPEMTLNLSSNLTLHNDAALWTFADLAIKGAGKTYAAADMAEEMVKAGIPIIVIDPIGVWWGLRVGADESKPGLPVVVFGGDHKDMNLPVKMGMRGGIVADEEKLKLMAKSILESGISAVLDTSEFSKSLQRRLAAIFIDEVFHLNKGYGVRHIFIEEADFLCPQRLDNPDVAFSKGAVDDLVRRGGNFNLGSTLISQRSAVLNKDVLTQCNCLIVMRTLHKLDKDAVHSWVESMAQTDDKKLSKWYDSLRDLKNGEAWVWHPETNLFKRTQFRKRETLHATREYFRQESWEQKNIRLMDVETYISKFKNTFQPKPKIVENEPEQRVPVVQPSKLTTRQSDSDSSQTVIRQSEPPARIDLEHKQLVINLTHSERVVSMDTESQRGQVIYLLGLGEDKTLSMRQIVDEASEYGWVIPYDTARKSLIPGMVRDGLLVSEGETAGTRYRLPRFVKFDVRKVSA